MNITRTSCCVLAALCFVGCGVFHAGDVRESPWVQTTADGLMYKPDAEGDRIADFSQVGYRAGKVPIPGTSGVSAVPVVKTISPVEGDNTKHIQDAITEVARMPLQTNGFRGALLLKPGTYSVGGEINVCGSGIVLRGSDSSGADRTLILATGSSRSRLLTVGLSDHTWSGGFYSFEPGSEQGIVSDIVPVGARSFRVENGAAFAVGDEVMVVRKANQDWAADAVSLKRKDGLISRNRTMGFYRTITHIEGNEVTVGIPLMHAFEAMRYGSANMRIGKRRPNVLFSENIGVEHLALDCTYDPSVKDRSGNKIDEAHRFYGLLYQWVKNAWARDVVTFRFGRECISTGQNALYVTVQDCFSYDPVAYITGGRGYPYQNLGQLNLYKNGYAERARHAFVTFSTSQGPNVYTKCVAKKNLKEAGAHLGYSVGFLYDNVEQENTFLNLTHIDNHGMVMMNTVAWNTVASGSIRAAQVYGGQNWVIGGSDTPLQPSPWAYDGYYEQSNATISPASLYETQKEARTVRATNMDNGRIDREHWVGEVDLFDSDDDSVPVDKTWLSTIKAQGETIDTFDQSCTGIRWVPFSFSFTIPPGYTVTNASLALGMKKAADGSDPAMSDILYTKTVSGGRSFSSLGWADFPAAAPDPSVPQANPGHGGYVTTLKAADLADGKLNAAIKGHAMVDWAVLNFGLIPTDTYSVPVLIPEDKQFPTVTLSDLSAATHTVAKWNSTVNVSVRMNISGGNAGSLRHAILYRGDHTEELGRTTEPNHVFSFNLGIGEHDIWPMIEMQTPTYIRGRLYGGDRVKIVVAGDTSPELLGKWSFDNVSGTSVPDLSGQGNDLVMKGQCRIVSDGAVFGSAVEFPKQDGQPAG